RRHGQGVPPGQSRGPRRWRNPRAHPATDRERGADRRDVRKGWAHHQGGELTAITGRGRSTAQPTSTTGPPTWNGSQNGGWISASAAIARKAGGSTFGSPPSVHSTTAPRERRSPRSIHGARLGLPSISTRGRSGA